MATISVCFDMHCIDYLQALLVMVKSTVCAHVQSCHMHVQNHIGD